MNVTDETLNLVKEARSHPDEELAKAWTQSGSAITGVTAYDLEAPAKKLYPVLTPLRNKTPRVSGKGGIQANWRAITGINTANMSMGLSEGQRGGAITTTVGNYLAAYVELGLEDYVTWKADLAAQGFDDVKALAVEGLLRACMIGEEKIILGGLGTWALGTTPTPAVTAADTGGLLPSDTYSVRCVALTLDGYNRATVAGGIVQAITRTNVDGTTDTINGGSALYSALSADATVTTETGKITCTVTSVPGAVAYAWFWGVKGSNILLGAITTVNAYIITAVATGTQTIASLVAADYSQDAYVFDGLLSQIGKSASGAYVVSNDAVALTADGAGGITQIDTALKAFWDNYRLSPSTIWVSSQEQKNISTKVLYGTSGTAAQRFVFTVEQGAIAGGVMVTSYRNKFSMAGAADLPIKLHPNMPPGTLMFDTDALPYPLSNVSNVVQMKLRRDYFQIEWPINKRRWEYAVYFDGVLQNYFPPAFGVISNIANG